MAFTVLSHDKRDITFPGKTKFWTIDFTSVLDWNWIFLSQ